MFGYLKSADDTEDNVHDEAGYIPIGPTLARVPGRPRGSLVRCTLVCHGEVHNNETYGTP